VTSRKIKSQFSEIRTKHKKRRMKFTKILGGKRCELEVLKKLRNLDKTGINRPFKKLEKFEGN